MTVATMVVEDLSGRRGRNLFVILSQWWEGWWPGMLLVGAMVAFFFLVVYPWTSVMEDRINQDFPEMGYPELERKTTQVLELLQQPVIEDGMETYFYALSLHRQLVAQCRYINAKSPGINMDVRHPCNSLDRKGMLFETNLAARYQNAYGADRKAAAANAYYGKHPDRGYPLQVKIDPFVTDWHPENVAYSYFGGALWTYMLFLWKSWRQGRVVVLDVISPRYLFQSLLWVKTVWRFYPGSPREQMKELVRYVGYFLAALLSFTSCGLTKAFAGEREDEADSPTPITWTLTATAQSLYVTESNHVVNPGWSFQPLVVGTYGPCSAKLWASIGLQPGLQRVDEVDAGAGCRLKGARWFVETWYTYFWYTPTGTGMHVPKLWGCLVDIICGKFQLLIPNTGAQMGEQLAAWRDDKWNVWGYQPETQAGFTYTRGLNGMKDLLVFRPKLTLPIDFWEFSRALNLKVFGTANVPLNHTGQGNDGFVGFVGVTASW